MNEKLSELVWALLRVLFGFSIAAHGYAILSDNSGWASQALLEASAWGSERFSFWMKLPAGLALIGGAALALGLFTRPVAFVLSALLGSVLYVQVFQQQVPYVELEWAACYFIVFMSLTTMGGGRVTLDRLIKSV
jgi:putative oxidoreductase